VIKSGQVNALQLRSIVSRESWRWWGLHCRSTRFECLFCFWKDPWRDTSRGSKAKELWLQAAKAEKKTDSSLEVLACYLSSSI